MDRTTLRHAVRFAVVGVVNTGVYYGTYLLLSLWTHYLVAHLGAILVAMVGSFLLNCYWTFRTRPTWRKLALFPLTNATNYVMTTVGVVALVEWLAVDERVAPLLAAVAAIPVTFLLSRRLLTGNPAAATGEPVEPGAVQPAPPGAPR
ncbi:GtrA family protein [Blastococcus sp. SYSU DS0619]